MSRSVTSTRSSWPRALAVIVAAVLIGLAIHLILVGYVRANSAGYVTAAGRAVAHGEDAQALTILSTLSSSQAAVTRSQAYLEQGSGAQALNALQNASGAAVTTQKGLCQATQAVTSANALELGQELYVDRLPRSAIRVLAKAPDSSAKYSMLADAKLQIGDAADAQTAAEKGSGLDPSNLQLHELLEQADNDLHDSTGAAAQANLIQQLKAGSI